MKKDILKKRIRGGDIVIGTWCTVPSFSLVNIIASTGLDFVIIDSEHGPLNPPIIEQMIIAAEVENCTPLVRVAARREELILSALDSGSHGIIVPHIETITDAEEAISYCKYSPAGIRGFSPFTRAGKYSLFNVSEHAKKENDETMVIAIIEGELGIKNLKAIANLEHIDVIYIGVYDLSQTMGFPGQVDHPKVQTELENCIKIIRANGKAAGGYVAKNSNDINWMVNLGMQFITYRVDTMAIFHTYNDIIIEFKKHHIK